MAALKLQVPFSGGLVKRCCSGTVPSRASRSADQLLYVLADPEVWQALLKLSGS